MYTRDLCRTYSRARWSRERDEYGRGEEYHRGVAELEWLAPLVAAASVPGLVETLTDADFETAAGAASILAERNARPAAPAILALLERRDFQEADDDDRFVYVERAKGWTASALISLDPALFMDHAHDACCGEPRAPAAWRAFVIAHVPDAAKSVPVPSPLLAEIRKSCADPDADVRCWALRSTVDLVGGEAGPELARALADPQWTSSDHARDVLCALGPEAASATPPLITLLAREDTDIASTAAYVLGEIGPAARAAVPALVAAWERGDVQGALLAVAEIDPDVALPLLRAALAADAPVERRREAAEAASSIALDEKSLVHVRTLVPELAQALLADDRDVVQSALEALQMVGKDAGPARTNVERLLSSPDTDIRRWAEVVMEGI